VGNIEGDATTYEFFEARSHLATTDRLASGNIGLNASGGPPFNHTALYSPPLPTTLLSLQPSGLAYLKVQTLARETASRTTVDPSLLTWNPHQYCDGLEEFAPKTVDIHCSTDTDIFNHRLAQAAPRDFSTVDTLSADELSSQFGTVDNAPWFPSGIQGDDQPATQSTGWSGYEIYQETDSPFIGFGPSTSFPDPQRR
jgi:hypothetical protein